MPAIQEKVGFIGVGAMGGAIARALVRQGVCEGSQLYLSDVRKEWAEGITRELRANLAEDNVSAARASDILILAVKPQTFPDVARTLQPALRSDQLVISILGGVRISTLEASLGDAPVVRVMPNILAEVGAAYSVYALGRNVSPDQATLTRTLLSSFGEAEAAEEKLLDAVTGLSGSGPGFAFVIMEALADGGVKAGLPRPLAIQLAAHTLLGSAKMLLETGEHPGALKDRVTSPAGTTIAGIAELEDAGIRSALIRAVDAAARRSAELSGK
jgi:pyrroline-5-carboxylate reductase